MRVRVFVLLSLVLLFASLAVAEDKDKDKGKRKVVLPGEVLQARTVLVVVRPESGISPTDPRGNQIAQQDVENALTRWGRFTPILDARTADLVITVRKGSGRMVNPTISGGPLNHPSVVLGPSSGADVWRAGGQRGHPPDLSDPGPNRPQNTTPHPSAEIGQAEDAFEVYRGREDYPLDGAPVWRYVAKDALRSPNVPAVEEFRKLIEEAEKQQKGKP